MTAEGPATVTPEVCALSHDGHPCGVCEGPATVTLTDDEREPLGPFIWGAWVGVAPGREAEYSRELQATVERIVAARVAALTADLATAERQRDDARSAGEAYRRLRDEAERVIANVRGLADFYAERAGMVSYAQQVAIDIRSALRSAPTGEGS